MSETWEWFINENPSTGVLGAYMRPKPIGGGKMKLQWISALGRTAGGEAM